MSVQKSDVRQKSAGYSADVDLGLRKFMLQVYNYMTLALILTGVVAFGVSTSQTLVSALYASPLKWVIMLAPLGIVFFLSFKIHSLSLKAAQTTFWVYAGAVGLSLGYIFLIYTGASVARVFFITAATFGATSLYGYTTQKDLSSFGSFLFMGLIGIVIASVVNLFLKSNALTFAISIIGVLVFVGLTAYDTQNIRQAYMERDDQETSGKKAIFGALQLYLDFINLFVMLLRLLGDRR
jgi:FtsH-binding integral membrane protein